MSLALGIVGCGYFARFHREARSRLPVRVAALCDADPARAEAAAREFPGASVFTDAVAKGIGVDPVHLGIILTCNLAMGLFTPPVGGTLFVSAKIADARMWGITKELAPMFGLCCIVLAIVTYMPGLVMAPVHWFR